MEVSLGGLFGIILLIQTILIFTPLPGQQGETGTNSALTELQTAIGNHPNNALNPDPRRYPYGPSNNMTILWTIGTVIPALIVYKKGGNFAMVFSIGLLGWSISKILQALTFKGTFTKVNAGASTDPIYGSPQVRAMHFWKRAFELTGFGTMAAAFLTLRNLEA